MEFKKTFVVMFAVSNLCSAIAAESPLSTGNTLYPFCTSTQSSSLIVCASYVTGVVVGAESQAALTSSQRYFCVPKDANNSQLIAIFTKHLTEHPEQRHFDSASLIFMSMKAAFPCTK